jgi:hypothetical protein
MWLDKPWRLLVDRAGAKGTVAGSRAPSCSTPVLCPHPLQLTCPPLTSKCTWPSTQVTSTVTDLGPNSSCMAAIAWICSSTGRAHKRLLIQNTFPAETQSILLSNSPCCWVFCTKAAGIGHMERLTLLLCAAGRFRPVVVVQWQTPCNGHMQRVSSPHCCS